MKYGDGNSKATVAVLLYLFRRIQKKLDGRPTLIVLDEAWVYLRDEFIPRIPARLAEDVA